MGAAPPVAARKALAINSQGHANAVWAPRKLGLVGRWPMVGARLERGEDGSALIGQEPANSARTPTTPPLAGPRPTATAHRSAPEEAATLHPQHLTNIVRGPPHTGARENGLGGRSWPRDPVARCCTQLAAAGEHGMMVHDRHPSAASCGSGHQCRCGRSCPGPQLAVPGQRSMGRRSSRQHRGEPYGCGPLAGARVFSLVRGPGDREPRPALGHSSASG